MVRGHRFTADLVQRGKERLARSYSYLSETPGLTSFLSLQAILLMKSQLRAKKSSMAWHAGLGEKDIVFNRDGNAEHVAKKLLRFQPLRIVMVLKS